MANKITTKTKKKKKPHKVFKQVTQFDSIPTELVTEAKSTVTTIKNISTNPYKYSFGKIRFPHGIIEACIYLDKNNPQKMPNSVLWYCTKDHFAKGKGFVSDKRRTEEVRNVTRIVDYFLSLSPKRRLKYLRNKGVFANIDITRVGND